MTSSPLTPVIVGVGDIVNRSLKVADALEPRELMRQAILKALNDTELPAEGAQKLISQADIDVVAPWTWPYEDLPSLLASDLGTNPRHKYCSPHGGNQPVKLLDEGARRIAYAEAEAVIITGGEALASLGACVKSKQMPPPGWTKLDQGIDSVFSPTSRSLPEGSLGSIHSIGAPIHVYPLYENAYRAHKKQSIEENHRESSKLYAQFAQVAAQNQYAWNFEKPISQDAIGSISPKNRMICFPYPLLMNAFNNINLAGACLVTSTKLAEELGIPRSKWIFPLGGAGTSDSFDFWDRPNFYSSPAISYSLDAGLAVSKLSKDNIDIFDFYSCFPIVPKLASEHLGFSSTDPPKPITLLGGLTSFGGAGNNYSMHAITEMTRILRRRNVKNGLILANGGVMSYQHVICLSNQQRPSKSPYPKDEPLEEMITEVEAPEVDLEVEGPAIIETYTVEFDRLGAPLRGHVVGRSKANGHRFIANHGDSETLRQLSSMTEEPIGRSGTVRRDDQEQGRNLFFFDRTTKL